MKNAKVRFTFMGIRVPGLHYPLGQQGVKNIRAVNDRMRNEMNAFCCYSLQLNPNYYLIPPAMFALRKCEIYFSGRCVRMLVIIRHVN